MASEEEAIILGDRMNIKKSFVCTKLDIKVDD
jgi:hypothetical protein